MKNQNILIHNVMYILNVKKKLNTKAQNKQKQYPQ